MADLGCPITGPVQASTSSTVIPSVPIKRSAFSMENVPMRLAMKFGVSFATTTPFPKSAVAKLAERLDHLPAKSSARESAPPVSNSAAD